MLQSVALRVSQKACEAIVQAIKKKKVAWDNIWFVLFLLLSLETPDNFKLLEKALFFKQRIRVFLQAFSPLEIWVLLQKVLPAGHIRISKIW